MGAFPLKNQGIGDIDDGLAFEFAAPAASGMSRVAYLVYKEKSSRERSGVGERALRCLVPAA